MGAVSFPADSAPGTPGFGRQEQDDSLKRDQLTIADLCSMTGLTRRTIRYYVQRGLVDKPHGTKKGAWYTEHHVGQLRAIKDLQDKNLSLDDIGRRVRATQAEAPARMRMSAIPEQGLLQRRVLAPANPVLVRIGTGVFLVLHGGRTDLTGDGLQRFTAGVERLYKRIKNEEGK